MKLHDYQIESKQFLLQRLLRHQGAGLWLDCGLGKTVIALAVIRDMIDLGLIETAAVIAPARVILTSWPKEIEKWGLDLTWSWLYGDEEEREAAWDANAQIQFVNCESLSLRNYKDGNEPKREQLSRWLQRKGWKPDLLVVDEPTKFKSWSAARSKVLRHFLKHDPKAITLTGTPMPNSMADIFSQQFILDRGETLSPYITHFREQYMQPCGYKMRDWEMRPEKIDELKQRLAPWYMHQSALDHLDMPELVQNPIDVPLPEQAMVEYRKMQREMFAEFESGELVALSAGSKYGICRQIASGAAYNADKEVIEIHDAKLAALADLWESLHYKPLLVAYWYQHEWRRLQQKFPQAEVINGHTPASRVKQIIADWQAGRVPMIVAQAGTISHGVDGLQHGGNDLCWYTLTDQPEIRYQLERRIFRQGVKGNQVRIHYLLAESTIDRTVYTALNDKAANEQSVIEAIRNMKQKD